jgi:hypothetical protein
LLLLLFGVVVVALTIVCISLASWRLSFVFRELSFCFRDVVLRQFSRHGRGGAAAPAAAALGMRLAGRDRSAVADAAVVGHPRPGLCRACA